MRNFDFKRYTPRPKKTVASLLKVIIAYNIREVLIGSLKTDLNGILYIYIYIYYMTNGHMFNWDSTINKKDAIFTERHQDYVMILIFLKQIGMLKNTFF